MPEKDDLPMRVEFVGPTERINPENDSVDVFLRLDDGRTYAFLVATPNNIYSCMENEGLDYFFGEPPVLVRRITQDSVERALIALVASGDETLNKYGTLSTGEGETKSGEKTPNTCDTLQVSNGGGEKTTVTLTIGKDEALVLFELLTDFFDEPSILVKDNADRMALSRLGGSRSGTSGAVPARVPRYRQQCTQAVDRCVGYIQTEYSIVTQARIESIELAEVPDLEPPKYVLKTPEDFHCTFGLTIGPTDGEAQNSFI
jgi:hypothetical protein